MSHQMKHQQRPCVVIGTYDASSYHQHPSQNENMIDGEDRLEDISEHSTDLFSYCRRSLFAAASTNSSSSSAHRDTQHHHQVTYKQQQQQQPSSKLFRLRLLGSLNQIKGPSGSVRGHKDVVRKSLENIRSIAGRRNFNSTNFQSFQSTSSSQQSADCGFSLIMQMDEQHKADYLERLSEDELGLCVAYTTTLGVIRRTFEDSKLMRSILGSNLIKYEERDIYLNQEYKRQLKLRCNAIQVPVLFVDGKHFGGIRELELMNEDGSLALQLAQFKMSEAPRGICCCCGNAKFIACQSCHGSRKSAVHHFKYNSIALRCIRCDKNDGLVECPVCCSTGLVVDDNNNNNNNNNISSKI